MDRDFPAKESSVTCAACTGKSSTSQLEVDHGQTTPDSKKQHQLRRDRDSSSCDRQRSRCPKRKARGASSQLNIPPIEVHLNEYILNIAQVVEPELLNCTRMNMNLC